MISYPPNTEDMQPRCMCRDVSEIHVVSSMSGRPTPEDGIVNIYVKKHWSNVSIRKPCMYMHGGSVIPNASQCISLDAGSTSSPQLGHNNIFQCQKISRPQGSRPCSIHSVAGYLSGHGQYGYWHFTNVATMPC